MAQQRARGRQGLTTLYIAGVCLAALAIGIRTWQPPPLASWPLLLTLVVLTGIARRWKIDLYGRGSTSTAIVVQATGALLFGPTAGFFLGITSQVLRWPWKKGRLHRYLFDASMCSIVAAVIGVLPSALDQHSSIPFANAFLFIGNGFMVGAFGYLLNIALVSVVMAIDERLSPLTIWRERFAWLTSCYAVFGLMAMGMALAGKYLGVFGVLIFALPVFAMRLVTQQYVERTKANVEQLRTAHDALRQAHDELAEKHDALGRAYAATRTAFSGMLNARDNETEGHSERVVHYALAIGEELGLAPKELAELEVGALLHDIGKVGVPDAILHKPGPLTSEEWQVMRRHPEIGAELVGEIPFLRSALPVVRHHHERWDGSGYPDGLRGAEIPLAARIFAIADVYDALISDRPYRAAMPPTLAIAEIEATSGSHFDPAVVAAFTKLVRAGAFARPYLTAVETPGDLRPVVTYRRRATDWGENGPVPRRAQVPPASS